MHRREEQKGHYKLMRCLLKHLMNVIAKGRLQESVMLRTRFHHLVNVSNLKYL